MGTDPPWCNISLSKLTLSDFSCFFSFLFLFFFFLFCFVCFFVLFFCFFLFRFFMKNYVSRTFIKSQVTFLLEEREFMVKLKR